MNFSKAAESINISQPAVSHQITSLEDELGVKLFLRTSKSVKLTAQGVTFISDATEMLNIARESKRRLSERNTIEKIRLGIGCHNQAELDLLPPILKELIIKYRGFFPDIRNIPFKSLHNMLEENKIDLMISMKDDDEKVMGYFTKLCKIDFALVCSEDYPLAKRENIRLEDLAGIAVGIERHKCPDQLMRRYNIFNRDLNMSDIFFTDGYENAIALVKANIGCAIMPVLPGMKIDGLKIKPLSEIPQTCLGIYTRKKPDTDIVKDFIKTAVEIYGK